MRRGGWPARVTLPQGAGEHVSLSFVRTIAEIAAQQQRGILWGNDLPSRDWREHSWRTMLVRLQARQREP